jgi:hypothetical protein
MKWIDNSTLRTDNKKTQHKLGHEAIHTHTLFVYILMNCRKKEEKNEDEREREGEINNS